VPESLLAVYDFSAILVEWQKMPARLATLTGFLLLFIPALYEVNSKYWQLKRK
jgi:hypothetical protein